MTTLRHRLAMSAFWTLVIVAVFVAFLATSHVLVTGQQDRIVFEHKTLAYDDGRDDDGNSGGDYGNGNDQRHCHESQNCRGSFSPGPFDRSPVDIHDNCISLDCGGYEKKPGGQKPASLTDPTKLPQAITAIVKAGLDMGQLFADGTIKFVESLFTALA